MHCSVNFRLRPYRLATKKNIFVSARGCGMSLHLQDHRYFWYFVLFHFVNFRDACTSTCIWKSRWTFADALPENIRSNLNFCFDNCLVLFICLTCDAHTATCLWAYIGRQSTDWRQVLLIFLGPRTCGHRFQITRRILFFCFVLLRTHDKHSSVTASG